MSTLLSTKFSAERASEEAGLSLSFTSLLTFRKDPEEYRRLFIHQGYNPLFDNKSVRIGMFIHEVLAKHLRTTDSLFPISPEQAYRDAVIRKESSSFIDDFVSTSTKHQIEQGLLMLKGFDGEVAEVEKEYRLSSGRFIFVGKVDCLVTSPGRIVICDFKTAPTIFAEVGWPEDVQLQYLCCLYLWLHPRTTTISAANLNLYSGTIDEYSYRLTQLRQCWRNFEELANEIAAFREAERG